MTGDPIIIRVPIQRSRLRINGADREVFRFKGFWHAEYSDGDVQVITNPLKEWFQSLDNPNATGQPFADKMPQIYFVLDSYTPGDFTQDPNNPTLPTSITSVTDDNDGEF